MEILFWLAPAAAVTIVVMLGVAWWGREGRSVDTIDRDEAVRRLGAALGREQGTRPGYAVAPRPPEPSSGVALRASTSRPQVVRAESDPETPETQGTDEHAPRDRRAS